MNTRKMTITNNNGGSRLYPPPDLTGNTIPGRYENGLLLMMFFSNLYVG